MKSFNNPFFVLSLILLSNLLLTGTGCSSSSLKNQQTISDKTEENPVKKVVYGEKGEEGQFILSDINPSEISPQEVYKGNKTIEPSSLTHIKGKGNYTFVEYADTECPYSKEFHATLETLMFKYEDKIQWGYKHFPLNQHIQKATLEAEATECAGEQEKFWEYVSLLYERTPSNNDLPSEELFAIADDISLNREDFDACIANASYNEKVKQDSTEAQEVGAQGTPFSVILDENNVIVKVIRGFHTTEELKEIFDSYVK